MKITQLCLYPIKSLRPISLPSVTLCAQGLAYDRRYVLLKVLPDGAHERMFVGNRPEMALVHCKLTSLTTFSVEYHMPSPPVAPLTPSQQTTLEVPLEPDTSTMQTIIIKTRSAPTSPAASAWRMPDTFNTWFNECFGYKCILAYTGDNLGEKMEDEKAQAWAPKIQAIVPGQEDAVNFSEGAALLVASASSMQDLHPRLPDGEQVLLEKFRPNIVIDGDGVPWAEDYWAELTVPTLGGRIVLTSNCARCRSINVDLDKGRMGEGESGKLLKKLMKDRRVDPGKKWEPIFGRYGFPTVGGEIRVGDEVVLSKRNDEHTVWNGIMPRLTRVEEVLV